MKINVLVKFKNFLLQFWLPIILIVAAISLPLHLALKNSTKNKIDPAIFQNKDYQKFNTFAKKNGPEIAYQVLKNQYKNNEVDAHDFAHIIGLVAYQQKGTGGLSVCDTGYNYGCYHGFIEGFLIKNGVEKVTEIEKSCIDLGPVHAPSCLHGIGHGLMINSTYNLKPALSDCDRLKESSRIYCWDGVFMERLIGSMQPQEARLKVTESNLDEPCATIDKTYKNQCWRNQVTVWFQFYQTATAKILKKCSALDQQYQPTCQESVGLINVQSAGENLSALLSTCSQNGSQLVDDCLMGEMKELLFEGKSPQVAQSLCAYVTSKNSQNCNNTFNQHFSEYQTRFAK